MADFASESGHWYTREGQPFYTIVGKNGRERNTTLADAKKLGLLPSATTIARSAAAPQLEEWKKKQALKHSLLLPPMEGEDVDAWVDRVLEDYYINAQLTPGRGTDIHGAIERRIQALEERDTELVPFAEAAMEEVNRYFPGVEWEAERSFASPLGYGGRIDLYSKIGIVLDFKSKDTNDPIKWAKVKAWDEQIIQLVAYGRGLGFDEFRTANVFVSQKLVDGKPLTKVVEHTAAEQVRAWRQFLGLFEYYKATKGL